MADNSDLSVKVGADISDLDAGMNQAKSAVADFSSGIDGIKSQFDAFGDTVKTLAGLLGVAFSVDALKDWISTEADLGEQMERTAAKLGITAQEASQLAGMAKLTGTDFQTLQMNMERFQVGLASAHDGTSRVAQALKALGLNAKEFIGVPIPEQLNKLAEATAKFADGSNKTAALMAGIGRGAAEMIPFLDRGKEGMQELADIMQRTGAVMTNEQAAAFAKTKEDISEMSLAWQGLSNRIYSIVNPAIDAAIEEFTKLIEGMSVEKIRASIEALAPTAAEIAVTIIKFCNEVIATWERLRLTMDLGRLPSVGEVVRYMTFTGPNPFNDLATTNKAALDKINSDLVDANAKLDAESVQWKKTFASMFVSPAGGAGLDINAIRAQFGLVAEAARQAAGAMSIGADKAAADEIKATEESVAGQIKAIQDAEQQKAALYTADVKLHLMSESQKVAATKAALQDELQDELGLYQAELDMGNLNASQQQAILNKMAAAQAAYDKQIQALNIQAAEQQVETWQKAFSEINSAFDSQISGLLKGTTNWSTAVKNVLTDLTTDVIKYFVNFALQSAENVAMQLAGQKIVTAGAIQSSNAQIAAQAMAAAAGVGTMLANVGKIIATDAAQVFAGVAAFLAPVMGPAALGPAAASESSVLAAAGAIGGMYDVGSWSVPSDMIAQVHQGEMIVPAAQTPWAQSLMANGGGGGQPINITFAITAMDSQSIMQSLGSVKTQLARVLSDTISRNPSLRPSY